MTKITSNKPDVFSILDFSGGMNQHVCSAHGQLHGALLPTKKQKKTIAEKSFEKEDYSL